MWHGDGMVWHHGMASWGAAGLDRNENRTIPPAASAVPCIWLGFDETSCRAAVDCDLSRTRRETAEQQEEEEKGRLSPSIVRQRR